MRRRWGQYVRRCDSSSPICSTLVNISRICISRIVGVMKEADKLPVVSSVSVRGMERGNDPHTDPGKKIDFKR